MTVTESRQPLIDPGIQRRIRQVILFWKREERQIFRNSFSVRFPVRATSEIHRAPFVDQVLKIQSPDVQAFARGNDHLKRIFGQDSACQIGGFPTEFPVLCLQEIIGDKNISCSVSRIFQSRDRTGE